MVVTAGIIPVANEVSQNEVCMMKVEGKYYVQKKLKFKKHKLKSIFGTSNSSSVSTMYPLTEKFE